MRAGSGHVSESLALHLVQVTVPPPPLALPRQPGSCLQVPTDTEWHFLISLLALACSDNKSWPKGSAWSSTKEWFLIGHSCAYRIPPPTPMSPTPVTLGITSPPSPRATSSTACARRVWGLEVTTPMTPSLLKEPGTHYCVGRRWLPSLPSELARTEKSAALTGFISRKLKGLLW